MGNEARHCRAPTIAIWASNNVFYIQHRMLKNFSILTHKHGKLENVIQETIERSLAYLGQSFINATICINHQKCHHLEQSKVVISFFSALLDSMIWCAYDVHVQTPNSVSHYSKIVLHSKQCVKFIIWQTVEMLLSYVEFQIRF